MAAKGKQFRHPRHGSLKREKEGIKEMKCKKETDHLEREKIKQ